MKRTGRNFRRRFSGFAHIADRLSRARYFRGHGVHSPFVYGLVRNAFMVRRLPQEDRRLYDELCRVGVTPRRAIQLQHVFSYCGYRTFGLNCAKRVDMNILTVDFPEEGLSLAAARAAAEGTTLCVMAPYAEATRTGVCRSLVGQHRSTSVDNRGYLLLFNNRLPKQHFKL